MSKKKDEVPTGAISAAERYYLDVSRGWITGDPQWPRCIMEICRRRIEDGTLSDWKVVWRHDDHELVEKSLSKFGCFPSPQTTKENSIWQEWLDEAATTVPVSESSQQPQYFNTVAGQKPPVRRIPRWLDENANPGAVQEKFKTSTADLFLKILAVFSVIFLCLLASAIVILTGLNMLLWPLGL
jgi:hypothetical protein